MTPPYADAPEAMNAGEALVAALPRISVVVPCHNEADSLDRLAVEMRWLKDAMAASYEMELIIVDDGSTDPTWLILQDRFQNWANVRLVRHSVNRGIAAAIQSGLMHATSEIVASLDADCTYEPLQLLSLLDAFHDGVDLVVASPYHPCGAVIGVPKWRLYLSRLASQLYGLVLQTRLHTYTSCFRVYRRSSVAHLPLTRPGFVGVAELVWQLDRRGGCIVECPAVLRTRTQGYSKMRTLRTAMGHLGLLLKAAFDRLFSLRSRTTGNQKDKTCFSNASTSRFSPRTT